VKINNLAKQRLRTFVISFPLLIGASGANAGSITVGPNDIIAYQDGCVTVVGGNCSQEANNAGNYESQDPVSAVVDPPTAETNYSIFVDGLGYFSNYTSENAVGAFSVPSGTTGGTISASGGAQFTAGYTCVSDGNWCVSGVNAGGAAYATFSTGISVDAPTHFSLTYSGAAGINQTNVSTGNTVYAWFGDFQNRRSITRSGVLKPGYYTIQVDSGGDAITCTPCVLSAFGVADFYLTITLSESPIAPRVAQPTLSAAGGIYKGEKEVSISSTTSGATIYYTNDGSIPTTASTQYVGPIVVSESGHINAIAVADGYTDSGGISASYVIEPPTGAPTFSPKAGTYKGGQNVQISASTSDSTIYYTTDGTKPTVNSTIYNSPIAVSATETIKAIAIAGGDTMSPLASGRYIIKP
jgi:hypothetical protein